MMVNEIKIGFSKEKFNIFLHILSEICSQKEVAWQDDQIGIKFSKDNFAIKEVDRSQSLYLSAEFSKNSVDKSKLDNFFIMFDVKKFLRSLNFCNLVQDKYETIDITFRKDRIVFLGEKKGLWDFRPNADVNYSTLPDISLPIKIENVDIEDFKKAMFFISDKDSSAIITNPIKFRVENNHSYIESSEELNMEHGQMELIYDNMKPRNTTAEILMSDYGLRFINKLAEKSKQMDFYFKEDGIFRANINYDYGTNVDVYITKRYE